MRPFCTRHARRDRCQHQDAFETFAENENADIKKRDGRTRLRLRRVRRAMGGEPLPHDHRKHNDRRGKNTDPKMIRGGRLT